MNPPSQSARCGATLALSVLACTLAPAMAHANLLVNSNLDAGYTGFSSDYTQLATNGTVSTFPGGYGLVQSPGADFTNALASYGDHTSGTGFMLFMDGAAASIPFWRETVSLAANSVYIFSYWATGGHPSPLPSALNAVVSIQVDGNAIDTGFEVALNGGGGNWRNVVETFTTTNAGLYTLTMVDLNVGGAGNDFSVDDLSLTGPPPSDIPEPAPVIALGAGLLGIAFAQRQRRR